LTNFFHDRKEHKTQISRWQSDESKTTAPIKQIMSLRKLMVAGGR